MIRLRRKQKTRPRVPDGTRIYAIGDIHGRLDLLDQVLDRIDADFLADRIAKIILVFLGDYIDRGPRSADVIERLIEVRVTHGAVCLRGNHEAMVSQFLADPLLLATWAQYGGLPTLLSYGLAPSFHPNAEECFALAKALRGVMPADHLAFFNALPLSFFCGDYFFVHAGIRPNIAFDRQTEEDLIWIRDDFLLHEQPHKKIVVHGHTPVIAPDVRNNRINIDTGAYATGRLTCLVLEDESMRFL